MTVPVHVSTVVWGGRRAYRLDDTGGPPVANRTEERRETNKEGTMGTYRVRINGFRVIKETYDDRLERDVDPTRHSRTRAVRLLALGALILPATAALTRPIATSRRPAPRSAPIAVVLRKSFVDFVTAVRRGDPQQLTAVVTTGQAAATTGSPPRHVRSG
jgi:hypothetical protein